MPNGKPGDHPLTDLLVHGRPVFSEVIDELIRQLAEHVSRDALDELVPWMSPPPMAEFERLLRDHLATAEAGETGA